MSYKPDPEHPLAMAFPYFPEEERRRLHEDVEDILTGILSAGPRVKSFEAAFATYCGAAHGVAFQSCTAALESALIALGVKPGDEVLVPPQTFVATPMSVHLVGAVPVFTETDPATMGMDAVDALARITPKTKGAIFVHFGGLIPAGFPAFVEEMHRRGLFVIEDAAHAHGAELQGRKAGAIGDAGCFSFYPTKIMTTGEGGLLVTSNDEVAATARSLQHRGRDLQAPVEQYARPGRNNRFSEVAAAMGLSQLRCLPGFVEARRAAAASYDQRLAGNPWFQPLEGREGSVSSCWRYVLTAPAAFDRPRLRDLLRGDGISVDWAYDPPAHLQPVFRAMYGNAPGMRPRTERLLARHLCLPMHARLRVEDTAYVVERLLIHAATVIGAPR